MSADIYVLAGVLGSTLVYPSQVHPSPPVPTGPSGGGGVRVTLPRQYTAYRDTDEDILAILGLL